MIGQRPNSKINGTNYFANQTYAGSIYFGSDDPESVNEALIWAYAKGWDIKFSNVVDRKETLNFLDTKVGIYDNTQ